MLLKGGDPKAEVNLGGMQRFGKHTVCTMTICYIFGPDHHRKTKIIEIK